jgi:ABC-type oligopeptide transport system substrate-binding subunit
MDRQIFVARESELEQLGGFLNRTLAGQGQVCFVTGAAGSGKTALVTEFARRSEEAHSNLVIAIGNCNSQSGIGDPYLPFREVLGLITGDVEAKLIQGAITQKNADRLRDFFRVSGQALVELGPDLIGTIVPGTGLAARAATFVADKAGWLERLDARKEVNAGGSNLEQSHIFEQYTDVLQALAMKKVLMLVVDDLQWADISSINLLFHLGRRIGESRILVIGTYRPEDIALGRGGEQHPLEGVVSEFKRYHGDIWVDLDRAEEAKGRRFVDAILDIEPNRLDKNFRQALFQHTEGHPLFTIELLREMQERCELVQDEQSRWIEDPTLNWSVLPARVEGVIEKRIERLEERLRETLAVASVEGEDFTAQVVAKVREIRVRQLFRDLSRELEKRHRLIHELEEVTVGRSSLSRYRFTHNLFQQYLYNEFSVGERRLLHREVARVLEQLYAGQTEEIAIQLAHHYNEAKQADQAIHYLLMAGDLARTSYAYEEAIDFYTRALEFLKELGHNSEAARVLMKLGLTYHTHLDFQNARKAYTEGFDLWQHVGEVPSIRSRQHAPHPLRVSSETPATLDPSLSYDYASNNIIDHLFSGLVELTPRMDIAPDVAQSWDVLDGGRKYLFHLRKDLAWSDGKPVTARDFEYAWKRKLEPSLGAQNVNLLYDVKGAKAFHQKNLRDPSEVGVKAIDSATLEVELEDPKGYFMYLLAYSPLFPIPEHIVETFGEEWTKPENIVTNGPFTLQDYIGGDQIILVRNPNYPGLTDGNVQQVELCLSDDWSSLLQLYESDELDVLRLWSIPPNELNRVRHRFVGEYLTWPGTGTFYVCFNVSNPPFNDPRVRRAFAMSIDKEWCQAVLQGITFPAMGGFVSPGIQGHSEGIGLPYDPQQARELLAEAGYPGGRGFPLISAVNFAELATYVESLQVDWKENLGIETSWKNLEWAPNAQEPPHLFGLAWGADYPDPDSFLRKSNILSDTSWHNDVYTHLVEEASRAPNQDERIRLFREADKILIEEAIIVPISYFHDQLLIKPWLKKYPVSPFRWLFGKDVIIEPH